MLKVVKVSGRQAGEFLDRVTAGTVRRLTVGQGSPGLLLNGQSRMIAQFDLLRMAAEEFWLVSPQECASELAEKLEQLHFSEELEIKGSSETVTVGKDPMNGERGKIFAWEDTGKFLRWPTGAEGFQFETGVHPIDREWEFARIGACLPWPVKDWDANTPALEAGQLFAIDREKGCYPGQEVVERSLNVGHPARVLIAVEGEGALVPGDKVALLPSGEGVVCSVAMQGLACRAFVRVSWNARAGAPAHFRKIRD